MVYKRMPAYSGKERLTRLSRLNPDSIRLSATEALGRIDLLERPTRVRLTTLASRPVYRFFTPEGPVTVYADDGSILEPLSPETAAGVVRNVFPEHAATARYEELLTRPDQWTFNTAFRLTGPLHKFSLGDSEATDVYVASETGEVVQKTDRGSRFWGYVGPVLHWIYFRPLRARGETWSNLIVYGSLAGCFVCVLGIIVGVSRYSLASQYKGGTSATPYAGWLRWHHYGGLIFGVITFTWLFSGMLSMEPWNLVVDNGPTEQQAIAVNGDGVDVTRFEIAPPRALPEFHKRFEPAELELQQFMGSAYYVAYDPAGAPAGRPPPHMLVRADGGAPAARDDFNRDELLTAARAAMPGTEPTEVTWLTDYDAYYYAPAQAARLPVLRVKFGDADATWLYLDAHNGALMQRETTGTRPLRWLYHGLHSLDFPRLYQTPWAWASLVVVLSAGGIFLSLTSLVIAWRQLRRTIAGAFGRSSSRSALPDAERAG